MVSVSQAIAQKSSELSPASLDGGQSAAAWVCGLMGHHRRRPPRALPSHPLSRECGCLLSGPPALGLAPASGRELAFGARIAADSGEQRKKRLSSLLHKVALGFDGYFPG